MGVIPPGMLSQTFEYVVAFTVAHEGDTPFMYNNWPLKNPQKDVTVGVGQAIDSTDLERGKTIAASAAIRSMFTVKATGSPADEDAMKTEFERVYNLPRTGGNLYTDYRDASPLLMDRNMMLVNLRAKLLDYWDQRVRANLPALEDIPAQAQVVLMSWNYGARLIHAPLMCRALNDGDFVTAAKQTMVPIWDLQKNEAHFRLMMNAGTIVQTGADVNKLPPISGPFKPPPQEPGATTDFLGQWTVNIGVWNGIFVFHETGSVFWADRVGAPAHVGQWSTNGTLLQWNFNDPGDFRTFTVQLPIDPANVSGTILPAGQGWFTMHR